MGHQRQAQRAGGHVGGEIGGAAPARRFPEGGGSNPDDLNATVGFARGKSPRWIVVSAGAGDDRHLIPGIAEGEVGGVLRRGNDVRIKGLVQDHNAAARPAHDGGLGLPLG